MRAGIALGSNLGNRLANLQSARREIGALPRISAPWLASAIYETEPVDCAADAGKFFNAVLEIGYAGEAMELLQWLREIERTFGRPLRQAKNTSRTLDLDLLYFADLEMKEAALQLPHPRMFQRRFVLEPLAEIRPDLILPGQNESLAALLQKLPATPPLRRVTGEW